MYDGEGLNALLVFAGIGPFGVLTDGRDPVGELGLDWLAGGGLDWLAGGGLLEFE